MLEGYSVFNNYPVKFGHVALFRRFAFLLTHQWVENTKNSLLFAGPDIYLLLLGSRAKLYYCVMAFP